MLANDNYDIETINILEAMYIRINIPINSSIKSKSNFLLSRKYRKPNTNANMKGNNAIKAQDVSVIFYNKTL